MDKILNKKSKKEIAQEKRQQRETNIQNIILQQKEKHVSSKNIHLLSETQLKNLSRYKHSEIEQALQSKQNISIDLQEKILSTLQNFEKSEVEEFLIYGKKYPKKYRGIISSIPPHRIMEEYLNTPKKKKLYLDALQKLPPNSEEANLWISNLIAYPDVFSENNLNFRYKKKILDIAETLNSSARKEIISVLDGIVSPDFFRRALEKANQQTNSNEEVLKKEAEMKDIITRQLGKEVVNRIEKNTNETMSPLQRSQVILEEMQYERSKASANALHNGEIDKYEYISNRSMALEIKLMQKFNLPAESIKFIQKEKQGVGKFCEALKKNDKATIAYLLHKMGDIPEKDYKLTLEQLEQLQEKKKTLIPTFTQATETYNTVTRIILDKIDNFRESVIDENDPRIRKVYLALQSAGIPISFKKLQQAISLGRFPTPTEIPFIEKLQQEFSTSSNNIPDTVINDIVISGPGEFIGKTPPSFLTAIISNPTKALREIEDPKYKSKYLKKLDRRSSSYSLQVYEELIHSNLGMDPKKLAALRWEEKLSDTKEITSHLLSDVLPFVKNLLEEAIDANPSPYSVDTRNGLEEIQKKLSNGQIHSIEEQKKIAHKMAILGKKSGGIDSINDGLSWEQTLRDFSRNTTSFAREIASIKPEFRSKVVEDLYWKEKGSILEPAKSMGLQEKEQRIKDFLNPQKGIHVIFRKFGSSESISQTEMGHIVSMSTPNGEDLLQPVSQLSAFDKKRLGYTEGYDDLFFSYEKNMIYVPDSILEGFRDFAKTGNENILNKKKAKALVHEAGHFFLKYCPQSEKILETLVNKNFSRIVDVKDGKEFFDNSGGSFTLTINDIDEHESSFYNEIMSHILAGIPYPPSLSEGIHRILSTVGGAQQFIESANKSMPDFNSAIEEEYKFTNRESSIGKAARNAAGEYSTNDNSPHQSIPEKTEEPIPLNQRATYVDQMEIYEDEMEKILEDFRKFKSKIPGDEKTKLEGWDEWFKERIESDKNEIASNPNLGNTKLKNILTSYTKDGKQTDPRNRLSAMMLKLSDATIGDRGFFGEAWANTTFLSMADIGKMWDTTWEYIKRQHERKSRKRTGEAGASMFDGLVNGLRNEFAKDAESAKKEEVSNIREGMSEMSTEYIYDSFIPRIKKADELEAVTEELADRGHIDWDNPVWGKIMHKLGSGITFYPSDYENLEVRDKKYQIALDRIFGDSDRFHALNSNNDSNINSNIDKWKGESEAKINSLTGSLNSWIENKREGMFVDPLQYEGYIRSLKEFGKGNPAAPLYYLIIGIAEGIINIAAARRFDAKYINDYPFSQLFLSDPSLEQIKSWEREILFDGKEKRYKKPENGVPGNFNYWVDRVVFGHPKVLERTVANQGNIGKFDHDHSRVLFATGSASRVKGMFAESSTGGQLFKPTVYNNISAGILEYTTMMASQKNIVPREEMRENIIRQFGYFAAFDGMANGRTHDDRQRFKFDSNSLSEPPREGADYNESMSTKDFLEASKEIFKAIPPDDIFGKFLRKIVFNSEELGSGKYEKNYKRVWAEFEGDPDITKALKESNTKSPDRKGETLYSDLIPAVIKYFMNKDDKYLTLILERANQVSSGQGNYSKWKSHYSPEDIPKPHNPESVSNYKDMFEKAA